jgi:tricorn protease
MRVTSGNLKPSQIRWSNRSPDLVYFRDGDGAIRSARVGGGVDLASLFTRGPSAGPRPGEAAPLKFKVKLPVRRDEEFGEMLEQSWRALAESFYDAKFHDVDWRAVRDRYRPLVKHCACKEDLYALINLMTGELNASHLGIYGHARKPEEATADLGLLFDEYYRGPGLKVAEVLKRGPADKRGLNLKAGEVILSIDGTPLGEKANLPRLLNGKAGETVTLQVTADPAAAAKDPKARRRVELQAEDRGKIPPLMYERWAERNAKRVAEASGGKLGYIHIPSMDEEGVDRFVRALYSDHFDKEAIVLDVRYNGGGYTHDQILNYLGYKEHAVFRNRYGGQGLVLRSYDRKWAKPLVLLINHRSYSDAEIFPNAFRTLGLGKLVGLPTGGQVIGTSSVRLIDGSTFRTPRIGVFTTKGVNMEREGVQPDVLVDEHPDQLAKGVDPQLDKAVEVLRQDVVAWKAKQQSAAGVASSPGEAKPAETKPPAPPSAPPASPTPTPSPAGR